MSGQSEEFAGRVGHGRIHVGEGVQGKQAASIQGEAECFVQQNKTKCPGAEKLFPMPYVSLLESP